MMTSGDPGTVSITGFAQRAGRWWQDVHVTDISAEPENPEEPEGLENEVKSKFREALERKRAREAGTAGGPGGTDAGKIQGPHGPASSRRSFRRRGGG
jgi:Family of unknown function (DUF5302)